MSDIVKIKEKTYTALSKIYGLRRKNPKLVREVLKKSEVPKKTWVSFFELYSSNEIKPKDLSAAKKDFESFCAEFTNHGKFILCDISDDKNIEVDWNALLSQQTVKNISSNG
jgi:hypothetical protein